MRDCRSVLVDVERLREELLAACDDAGLAARDFAVWIVDAMRPTGTTPIAYLRPDGPLNSLAVLEAVGSGRLNRFRQTAHRLAIWRELPGIPGPALGPILRHELEHARRWERSGPSYFEADDRLRDAVRAAGGEGYAQLPSEQEANAAAAAYAVRRLSPRDLEEVRATPECIDLFVAGSPPSDPAATRFRLEHDRDEPVIEFVRARSAPG